MRSRVPKASKRIRESAAPLEDHHTQLSHICRVLRSAHAGFLVGGSISVSPYEPRLVDSVKFSCGALDSSGSYNPFSPSSAGCAELHLMFGCGSAAVSIRCLGCLSDDNWTRHYSMCVAEYCEAKSHRHFSFLQLSLEYPVCWRLYT